MKKILLLIFLFSSIFAQAQNLKGIVVTAKDKSPAQFASVGLVHLPDSNLVTGVITLTDGAYLFEKIKPGDYSIKVTFMGYKTDDKNIKVNEGDTEIAVDTIYLSEVETTLNEATVLGERLKGKELVDRTIYSIPAVVAKSSTNGYEILKKIPQVNVDFQNNVTLNGSNNFIIQVDGRQRDKEFLAKLLPSDIESVEIISNPSGKYEGNIDGVINIILKKEARYGMNGNFGIQVKPFNKFTTQASGSLDYAMGKITFYVTGYIFQQNLDINTADNTYYYLKDSTMNSIGNGAIKVNSSAINSGFDYYLNEKNNLSFNVSYKPISQKIDIFSETNNYKSEVPLMTSLSPSNNDLTSGETTLSLFYKKTFKKAVQEFSAEANYYIFNSNTENGFTNTNYIYNSDIPISEPYPMLQDNINKRDYLSVKLNYVHPIGLTVKLETGYQMYYQQMSYDFKINNFESNMLFDYAELRHSIYGGFTLNLKKFGFQTMLRIENSNITAESVTKPKYTCFLPSVNLQYKFSASHNLKFTYNRRINRPGIYDMNPNPTVDQNNNVSEGNPDLKPDYRDRLQLTYTWNFGSNYFSPNIYYEFLSNKVGKKNLTTINPIDSSLTAKLTKPFNLLSGYEYGGGINAMLWFVNINARIFNGHFNEYAELPATDYFSYSITSYAYAPLDKKKTASAYVFLSYNGVNVSAQSKTYNMAFYGFGGQKQFKNHTIGAFYFLPFSSNVKLSRTETETTYYHSQNITGFDVSYYIMFSYSYKFNKGKNVKKLDRKIDIDSDSKTQGIGK